jgi:conserved repeat domain
VTITSTWAVSPSATGTIVNSASVTSTSTDSNGANNTATSSAAVVVSADVSVTKSGPATGVVGSNVTFNIVVTNAGPATATGVTLNDVAPAGLIFQSAGGACSLFPCTLGTMLPGATQNVAAVYKVNQAGALTNSAR